MGRYGSLDYPKLTKGGFLLGLTLFLAGAIGGAFAPAVLGSTPGWLSTVFVDMEAVGILLGLLSPIVFGVVLPLTE
ncbi:hypothetical protein ACFQPA_10215 [Halomarina halobia]|uniref:Major facilitator superfamily (MFS) profile domain-containing protein n=1 Tax=Halomarina halobia TaxID=3033386 RepID=A0ABD6AC98_9EURY|nr:hypothetical protein [Halomarina sp. PSR21]